MPSFSNLIASFKVPQLHWYLLPKSFNGHHSKTDAQVVLSNYVINEIIWSAFPVTIILKWPYKWWLMCIDIFVCLLQNLLNAATVQFFYELLFQMGLYDIWRPHTNLWSQLNAERVQKWLLWCLSNNGNHFIWESGSGDARDLLSHWCSQISQSIFWTTIMSSMNSGVFCVIWILRITELHSKMGTCTQMPFF